MARQMTRMTRVLIPNGSDELMTVDMPIPSSPGPRFIYPSVSLEFAALQTFETRWIM